MIDRKRPPAFNKQFSFNLIQPVSSTLANGVPIYFVSGGEQEVLKIELLFPGGRWHEKIWGASYFTTHLLSKGTIKKTSFEIASMFDHLGAHLDVHPGADFVSLSLYSLTKNIKPAIELLLEIVQYPVFSEKELEQAKTIYLQNLRVNLEKTSYVASRVIRKNIFGDNHPYGKELDEAEVSFVRREHLIEFHKHCFSSVLVIVSGKIAPENMEVINTAIASFNGHIAASPHHTPGSTSPSAEYVPKEGSVQSSIRMGKRSILRSSPDYPDLLLLNHILGGYFGSRLMKNLREDKGLTYGISSSLQVMKHGSYMMIGTDVNKENRSIAVDEIRKELRSLNTMAVAKDELETARNHFIGSIQNELSTSFAHADKIKSILLYDLEKNYYAHLLSRIESVTAEDLLRTAATHLQEDTFFEVSVG